MTKTAELWPEKNARGYKLLEQPYGTMRTMRVIFIGAGASGICFSKFAEDTLTNTTVQIYEKNADIGGTWLENRYPGCACDIPSVSYQFTWARNPKWSKYYSGSAEIWQYLNDIVEKYGLKSYMKFNHTVVSATWNNDDGLWNVRIRDSEGVDILDTCDVLINGSGHLKQVKLGWIPRSCNWQWPDIKGLHSFKGILQHSAHYDEGLDLNDKRVAVIGMGSSGIQITSDLGPKVKKLYTWIRSPTWVTAGFAQKYAGPTGGNFEYSAKQKKMLEENPELSLKYSKMVEAELNKRFHFMIKGTPEATQVRQYAVEEMTRRLSEREDLIEAMIPKTFGVGCRRPTPGEGFLEALTKNHVTVFTQQLLEVDETGFVDSHGVHHDVDAIICATGYEPLLFQIFPIVANGHNVQDLWAQKITSYLSIGVPHMPNYFTISGPYGPHGLGSFLSVLEVIVENFIKVIKKMQQENIKSLTPKLHLAEALTEHAELFLARTAWSSGCTSWFKQGRADGQLCMFPASRLVFMEIMKEPRFEDYDIEYRSMNPWAFFGNGFSTRQFDGRDLSYYLGMLQEGDIERNLEGDLQEFLAAADA
ncbi:hypothetical protein LTR84_011365 [Exophiala bonariae]|uniref:Uncharacterized protein n=1 Tax=Exophiala bonariae TaxID=1690606 RepID=A0AAV9MRU4_9EURO|nr:hypothetical protein LTR84_011365 [Exophiala bonariae]